MWSVFCPGEDVVFLSPLHTRWVFILLRPAQLLLVHFSLCVFPLQECPVWWVAPPGVDPLITNELLWPVLSSSDVQLKDNPAFSMLNDSDDEVIYRFVAQHGVVGSFFSPLSRHFKVCFPVVKERLWRYAFTKRTRNQSDRQIPGRERQRVMASTVKGISVNKNENIGGTLYCNCR